MIHIMADWEAERVVIGDGREDDTDNRLRKNDLYASDQRRGRWDTFWAVKKGSLQLWPKQDPVKNLRSSLQLMYCKHIGDVNGASLSIEVGTSSVMSSNWSDRMQYKDRTRVHGEQSISDEGSTKHDAAWEAIKLVKYRKENADVDRLRARNVGSWYWR